MGRGWKDICTQLHNMWSNCAGKQDNTHELCKAKCTVIDLHQRTPSAYFFFFSLCSPVSGLEHTFSSPGWTPDLVISFLPVHPPPDAASTVESAMIISNPFFSPRAIRELCCTRLAEHKCAIIAWNMQKMMTKHHVAVI
ncbi:hypothetical protein DMENIID0001_043230 [Sergentomyia squamirostris]